MVVRKKRSELTPEHLPRGLVPEQRLDEIAMTVERRVAPHERQHAIGARQLEQGVNRVVVHVFGDAAERELRVELGSETACARAVRNAPGAAPRARRDRAAPPGPPRRDGRSPRCSRSRRPWSASPVRPRRRRRACDPKRSDGWRRGAAHAGAGRRRAGQSSPHRRGCSCRTSCQNHSVAPAAAITPTRACHVSPRCTGTAHANPLGRPPIPNRSPR